MDPAHRLPRRAAYRGDAAGAPGGRYDLVVFDLDGTLCRLDVAWGNVRRTLAALLALRGLDPGPERSVLALLVRARADGPPGLAHLVARTLERAELAGALRCDVNAALTAWLGHLPAATPLAVLSLNAAAAVERALARAGLADRVADVVAREHVERFKPDPQGLLLLLERRRARPGRSLFIGDSERDAACAARAGVPYRDVRELGVRWADPRAA